ncbi:MAG: hypothetical protein M1296_02490 [Chloroflexi bacterium]|nr:hypothetical protein [Chloroflexota bacterium]
MRLVPLVATLGVLLGVFGPAIVHAQAPAADYDFPGGNGHFYTETNGGAGPQYGYRITNDNGINFWTAFQQLGGVAALGYPVSRRFTLDGFTVQATQKVIMQWRPTTQTVDFVNVFDELHDLGLDAQLQAQYQIPPQLSRSFDNGKATFQQIEQGRLALLTSDLKIQSAFFGNRSQDVAVLYNGLPTSTIVDAGPFNIIRAQRIAIQDWLVDDPAAGIHAGDISVVNGGDIAKTLGLIPTYFTYTETANGTVNAPVPTPTPTPAATPSPTPTPVPQFPYTSKDVTTPPLDCGSNNRVPCVSSAPNAGVQYIQGHILDNNGNGLGGVPFEVTYYSTVYHGVSESDGLFDFTISTSCPQTPLTFNVFVVDSNGNRISDVRTVNYTNCNQAGEFHFDFIRTS